MKRKELRKKVFGVVLVFAFVMLLFLMTRTRYEDLATVVIDNRDEEVKESDVVLAITYSGDPHLSFFPAKWFLSDGGRPKDPAFRYLSESKIKELQQALGISGYHLRERGELFVYYTNETGKDIFIAENRHRGNRYWKIYIENEDGYDEVQMKHDQKHEIKGFDIVGNELYLCSDIVRRVNLDTLEAETLIDCKKEFSYSYYYTLGERMMYDNGRIVDVGNIQFLDTERDPSITYFDVEKSVPTIFYYDLESGELNTMEIEGDIAGLSKYDEFYAVFCNDKEKGTAVVKLYDENLNLAREFDIDVQMDFEGVNFERVTFNSHQDRAYVDGKYLHALLYLRKERVGQHAYTIIDLETEQVIYQQNIDSKLGGRRLSSDGFYRNVDGEYLQLND